MDLWLAVLLSVVLGFVVAFGLGFAVIPWLHKLHFGQTILDIGPSWHKKKQGTPTMGGILFIAGVAVSVAAVLITDKLLGGDLLMWDNDRPRDVVYVKIFGGLLMAAAFGFIGFIDDYIKVVKKRNLGLTEMQKTAMQALVIVAYLFTLYKSGVNYMFIPYYGVWENGAVFWIVGVIALYCTVNAVNFLDGVDGLCTSVTMVAAVGFTVCAVLMKCASDLELEPRQGHDGRRGLSLPGRSRLRLRLRAGRALADSGDRRDLRAGVRLRYRADRLRQDP